jgi:hypothetical protein
MISAITAELPLPGGAYMTDYRYRQPAGERPLLVDSTPAVKTSERPHLERKPLPPENAQQDASPEPARMDTSSMFAAAVIAGALPPVPQTMEQLILRIGVSTIPEEYEARIKDLIA